MTIAPFLRIFINACVLMVSANDKSPRKGPKKNSIKVTA